MLELFQKGGPVMYPLLVCSVIAVIIILWRFYELHRVKVNAGEFMQNVQDHLTRNEIEDAISICESFTGPVVSIVKSLATLRV